MAEPTAGHAVRPTRGPWRFRGNCGLVVTDGSLVVSDHRSTTTAFPLDGSAGAPRHYVGSVDSHWWMVVDGHGDGIVQGEVSDWDVDELLELFDSAGIALRLHSQNMPVPALRDDAVELRWPALLHWSATIGGALGSVGLVVAFLAQAEVIPAWAAAVYFVVFFAMFIGAWRAGVFAGARPTKGDRPTQRKARG